MGGDVPLFGKPIRIKFNYKNFLLKLLVMIFLTGLFGYFWPSFFNENFNHGSLYCIAIAETLGLVHVILISHYALSFDYANRAVGVYVVVFLSLTLF